MVSKVQEKNFLVDELRAYEAFKSEGFLLFKQAYQESDLIVELLLSQGLKISALVRGGQKSVKRFGGKLEPFQRLKFQLRAPRGIVSFEKLFYLESADLLELYSFHRESWKAMQEGFFYLEFFRELFPKGELEPWVYPMVLKVFSYPSMVGDIAGNTQTWERFYVWSYITYKLGFGILGEKHLPDFMEESFSLWPQILQEEVFSPAAVEFLALLSQVQCGKVMEKSILKSFYLDWTQRSHLRCRSLETWLST